MTEPTRRPPTVKVAAPRGLAGWMHRVLEERDRAARGLGPDAVHDLRVALRRCRSMAEAMERVDPDPGWGALRRAARPLFRGLGELRDTHVAIDWARRTAPAGDPLQGALLAVLAARAERVGAETAAAVEAFDRDGWTKLERPLAERIARVGPGGPVFETLVVERWREAHELHRRASSARSAAGWHRLRIGIKKLRYLVENFVPARHRAWRSELSRMQDALGEVHDLDLLAEELARLGTGPGPARRAAAWRRRIAHERSARLAAYRRAVGGRAGFWLVSRRGLLAGDPLRQASVERLAAWGAALDPDPAGSLRVRRLALELADGLCAAGLGDLWGDPGALRRLAAAALLRDVARPRGKRGHHRASARAVRELAPPPGWTRGELRATALLARYHRGPEPRERHRRFAALDGAARRELLHLAAALRLAGAIDRASAGRALRVDVEAGAEVVRVAVKGYEGEPGAAARLARARHLLEQVVGRAVVVVPAKRAGGHGGRT